MTNLNRLTILSKLILAFQFSHGQNELFGSWKVNCPVQIVDGVGKFCGLCTASLKDDISLIVNDFEIIIDKSNVVFNLESLPIAVKYKWDSEQNIIEFQYKETDYKFKVLSITDNRKRVLKDKNGILVNLTKI